MYKLTHTKKQNINIYGEFLPYTGVGYIPDDVVDRDSIMGKYINIVDSDLNHLDLKYDNYQEFKNKIKNDPDFTDRITFCHSELTDEVFNSMDKIYEKLDNINVETGDMYDLIESGQMVEKNNILHKRNIEDINKVFMFSNLIISYSTVKNGVDLRNHTEYTDSLVCQYCGDFGEFKSIKEVSLCEECLKKINYKCAKISGDKKLQSELCIDCI